MSLLAAMQSHSERLQALTEISTVDDLGEWLTFYYQQPRPDLLFSALEFMSEQDLLEAGSVQMPVRAFLARVFVANPERIADWQEAVLRASIPVQAIFAVALWESGSAYSEEYLPGFVERGAPGSRDYVLGLIADNEHPDLLVDPITGPGQLDELWGSFFATGDAAYVERLISALQFLGSKPSVLQKLLSKLRMQPVTLRYALGRLAAWSLTSNAMQHPRVLEICEAKLSSFSGTHATALETIIADANAGRNSWAV